MGYKVIFHCTVCYLMVLCFAQDRVDIEGLSNDSPFPVEPKVESIRIKAGTPMILKCVNQSSNHTIWEYKECDLLYKGIVCNLRDLTNTDAKSKDLWKKLSNKHRFSIDPLKRRHSGLYRCIEKGIVRKSVIIEVIGLTSYDGPPPQMQSLLTSNITGQLNIEITIQCNITSIIPPTVIWFKKCYGSKCDIQYDGTCYCHLNVTTSSYNIGNTYISKMNIFNAREIDSGLYACLAVTEYGKDYKNVNIDVPDDGVKRIGSSSVPVLFLAPLALVVAPVFMWLCCFGRKKGKCATEAVEQQQHTLLNSCSSRAIKTTV